MGGVSGDSGVFGSEVLELGLVAWGDDGVDSVSGDSGVLGGPGQVSGPEVALEELRLVASRELGIVVSGGEGVGLAFWALRSSRSSRARSSR